MSDIISNRPVKYWWVNQNQTFRQEFEGGYLWSPRTNRDGRRNPSYENMREMAPGDIVFSFSGGEILALSIVVYCAVPAPKPEEFGNIGPHWDPKRGWLVAVSYKKLSHTVAPREHMNVLRGELPSRYSPLQADGRGNQAYLFEISAGMAQILFGLIGSEAEIFALHGYVAAEPSAKYIDNGRVITDWENIEQSEIEKDSHIDETERESLIRARVGQGIFRKNVMHIEKSCRITGVTNPEHLIGSHIKPWRESTNDERLDGENGLLLTPTADHLFDRGFISFENDGKLLISPVADRDSLIKMKIPEAGFDTGPFSSQQKMFLDFHRDMIFLKRSHRY